MRKKLSLILCIALIISLMPVTSAFAAKKIKAKSVSISPKAMTLAVGDIAQLNATKKPTNSTDKLTWTSSDKSVATVTSKGVVQGVSEGTATITVKTTSKKTANCVVTVKNYATDAELRESLKEELKAEFMKKDDLQAYLDQHVYGKAEIDKMFTSISTDGFATKDELQSLSQNTYTKSQIDEKISSLPSGGGEASCACELKTKNDVLNYLKQNTYTKEEIDEKIAGSSSDWEDGTSLICLNENLLPKTYEKTKVLDKEYNWRCTITNISCKKYKVMDYIENEEGQEEFVPYRYDITVSYSADSLAEMNEHYRGAGDHYYPSISVGFSIETRTIDLDENESSHMVSFYSCYDYDEFFLNRINLED